MQFAHWFGNVVVFGTALALCALGTPLVRDLALRRRLVDDGGVRKVHARATPRLGGLAIAAAWFVAVAVSFALEPQMRAAFRAQAPSSIGFLAGAVVIVAVGAADDLRGMRARHKLLGQFAAAAALSCTGFAVRAVELPGGAVVSLGVLAAPLTALWLAGVMNAVNLIDGLDGLAGGLVSIALLPVLMLCAALTRPVMATYALALMGAVLGFLIYNFNPATIFMGDAGSLFLGYVVGAATLSISRRTESDPAEIAIPVVALLVPLLDMALAIGRRALRGRPIFSADKDHLHHRLLALGLSQRQAVAILYAAGGVCALTAWWLHLLHGWADVGIALTVLALVPLALGRLGFRAGRLLALVRQRKANRALASAVDEITERLARATSLPDVVESVAGLGPLLGAAAVRMNLRAGEFQGSAPGIDGGAHARFALRSGQRRLGDLVVHWEDGEERALHDHAFVIERMCEDAARAVARVLRKSRQETPRRNLM